MIREYNREKAVVYAQKWALGANPEFYHFGGLGGDCTNFVSQCLLAGQAEMNYSSNGWFYISSYNRSASWSGVNFLQNFLLTKDRVGPFGEVKNLESLEKGDLIFLRQNPLRFNHSVIISKIENGQIFVCAHSDDSLDRPLSTYNFIELQAVHIIGTKTL